MSQPETIQKSSQSPEPKGPARKELVETLKRRILSGRYDADGKIDSLVDQLVRDAL